MKNVIRRWFSQKKLNIKFTIVIGTIVVIPFVIAFFIIFHNQKVRLIEDRTSDMVYEMDRRRIEVQKTVEMCNMSSQVFITNQELKDFLERLKKEEKIETKELIEFYRNDIGTLEKLVNSNPYLYQTRVYAYGENLLEMLPIIYKRERLKGVPWEGSYVSGEWQFDYPDQILSEGGDPSAVHMMSLVTVLEDYEQNEIGLLEVAVDMQEVFPEIFASSEEEWECFIDQHDIIYAKNTDLEEECRKVLAEDGIAKAAADSRAQSQVIHVKRGSRDVLIGYMPVGELSGYAVRAVDLEGELNAINRQRNIYLAGLAVILGLLFLIINVIVKVLLNNFYRVIASIRQVQAGNLDAYIEGCGEDEIGELGSQINKMLDRIKVLMQENIDRELLIKNSEIRALQNQINAHFIYNVLESIKMMAEIREEYDISDAVTSLGRLLRYSMKWVSNNVTIEQEIQYIKDYIWLMNLRFDYQIQLNIQIPDLLMKQEIPKMSLQPIVENAIYHGIEELAEDAVISIKGKIADGNCRIEITDSGKGMTDEQINKLEQKIKGEIESSGGSGNGIGLKNVQDRIRITFGEEYGLQIAAKEQCYTKVIVCIPLTHRGGDEV